MQDLTSVAVNSNKDLTTIVEGQNPYATFIDLWLPRQFRGNLNVIISLLNKMMELRTAGFVYVVEATKRGMQKYQYNVSDNKVIWLICKYLVMKNHKTDPTHVSKFLDALCANADHILGYPDIKDFFQGMSNIKHDKGNIVECVEHHAEMMELRKFYEGISGSVDKFTQLLAGVQAGTMVDGLKHTVRQLYVDGNGKLTSGLISMVLDCMMNRCAQHPTALEYKRSPSGVYTAQLGDAFHTMCMCGGMCAFKLALETSSFQRIFMDAIVSFYRTRVCTIVENDKMRSLNGTESELALFVLVFFVLSVIKLFDSFIQTTKYVPRKTTFRKDLICSCFWDELFYVGDDSERADLLHCCKKYDVQSLSELTGTHKIEQLHTNDRQAEIDTLLGSTLHTLLPINSRDLEDKLVSYDTGSIFFDFRLKYIMNVGQKRGLGYGDVSGEKRRRIQVAEEAPAAEETVDPYDSFEDNRRMTPFTPAAGNAKIAKAKSDTDAKLEAKSDTDAKLEAKSDTDARLEAKSDTDAKLEAKSDTDARLEAEAELALVEAELARAEAEAKVARVKAELARVKASLSAVKDGA